MDDWQKFGYASYEAWIDHMSGACPPCDDENHAMTSNGEAEDRENYIYVEGQPGDKDTFDTTASTPLPGRPGWPQPSPPPFDADDEDEAVPDPEDAPHAD